MKNLSRITRIHGFERFFEKNEGHLRRAEYPDVKIALELAAARRAEGNNGWSKDKGILRHGCIPRSFWFRVPEFWKGIDTNKMDSNEKADMMTAFYKTFSKFSNR